jgi:ammonia channel protein AmtB
LTGPGYFTPICDDAALDERSNPAIGVTCQLHGHVVSLAGSLGQFSNQLKGILFTMVFAGGSTFILLKIVNALVGPRVSEEEETVGLDLSQHGESAYND